jgi:hypothetical protein
VAVRAVSVVVMRSPMAEVSGNPPEVADGGKPNDCAH